MIDFFDKIKIFCQQFNTNEISELRIVKNKYVKYKKYGKWYRIEIKNFDKYSEPSYKCLEVILKNLFEEVKRVPVDVPIILEKNNFLYYLPKDFGRKEISIKDKILLAERVNPIFLKRYPKIDCSSSQFLAFHLGGGAMCFHYEDKNPEEVGAEELLRDIGKLHRFAFINKLSGEKIQKAFKAYYKELFPEILFIPKYETPSPKQIIEEKEVKPVIEKVKVKKEKPKKPRKKKVEKKKEELISLEKIKGIPYENVIEVIKNYNPDTYDFFGRVAKIEYEKRISSIKHPNKKKEIDYFFYFFISCSEKMNKKEAYLKFKEEIQKI